MPANLQNSAVATWWEKIKFCFCFIFKLKFHSSSKKGNSKECSNYRTVALISHAKYYWQSNAQNSPKYLNQEIPDVQAGFRKGRGTRDQIANIHWKKQETSRKTSTSVSVTMIKPFAVWITKTGENSSRDGNTRLPYLPPEKTVCRLSSNS